ncbi:MULTISPECIES: chitin-binding domain-containing protein [unclassified Pseudomonas]|uniref:chitin-binding domain-containing protein n=1 Tax=unclassified Pseudomonas TaxID=196821 RepID=UPI0030DB4139
MNGSRAILKNNALYKIAVGLVIAVSISACNTQLTEPAETLELPCRVAGYFKSQDRVGGFYRCVWNANINRWLQYPYTCPTGLEFSEPLQACVKP